MAGDCLPFNTNSDYVTIQHFDRAVLNGVLFSLLLFLSLYLTQIPDKKQREGLIVVPSLRMQHILVGEGMAWGLPAHLCAGQGAER